MPVGAQQPDVVPLQPHQHLRMRLLLMVAIAGLQDRQCRRHGFQQPVAAALAASVLWQDQHVGRQPPSLCLHQRRFGRQWQITGQQHRTGRAAHANHATLTILLRRVRRASQALGVEHLDDGLSPLDRLPGQTGHEACRRRLQSEQTWIHWHHPPARPQPGHGSTGAAGMAGIQMRHHQTVDVLEPAPMQPGQQRPFQCTAAAHAGRPRIEQQSPFSLFDQHHAALTDVECRDDQRIVRRRLRRRQRHRQQTQQAQPHTTQAARRQYQHGPQQRTSQHGGTGLRQLDTGHRQRIQCPQHLHQPAQLHQQQFQYPACQPRPPRRQQHHPDGHRRQHQPHPRNGHHIGHGADQ